MSSSSASTSAPGLGPTRLASEQLWLAWVRTGLLLVAIGILLWGDLAPTVPPAVGTFIVLMAALAIAFGTVRFHRDLGAATSDMAHTPLYLGGMLTGVAAWVALSLMAAS